MRRLLLLLPLCLALAPQDRPRPGDLPPPPILLRTSHKVSDCQSRPDTAEMERLARAEPIAFLQQCLRRYDEEVQSYRATLHKHERVAGKLLKPEVIDVAFREKPFSVRMDWREGMGAAQRTLYVEGQNDGQLLALPAGRFVSLIGVVRRDPNGVEAKKSSRMPISNFGIRLGTVSTLAAWRAARQRGDLVVIFRGTRAVRRAGGRTCWVLERVGYTAPEDDGITGATFYFDTETWLQVGTHLTGSDGLIAEYWFRDVRLEPDLPADTFTAAGLRRR
jgi:hypothetical protein